MNDRNSRSLIRKQQWFLPVNRGKQVGFSGNGDRETAAGTGIVMPKELRVEKVPFILSIWEKKNNRVEGDIFKKKDENERKGENQKNKSNRTTMRPLGIYLIGISIYILNMIHSLMISGDFGGFFLDAYGHTDGHTDIRTDIRTDGQTLI